ncbi:MAG: DUF3999 family protein [Chloroflexi bacterium]|nr:DUF3999 family protein [Chloroflexota bacterium]
MSETSSETPSETSLVEVAPDFDVYVHAAPDLSDLRVVEEISEREVPYKLIVERGEQRRASVSVTMRDLGHVAGQYTTFVLDLNQQGALHNELEISTSSQNFQRDVVVEGSEDGENWRVLDDKRQIFDFTISERRFTTRDTRVQYPSSTARFLRVRIIDGELAPLDVRGAVVFFAQQIQPHQTKYPITISAPVEDATKRTSEFVLDLENSGLPTNRLSLTIPQENFYRRVMLEGSHDNQSWSPLRQSENVYKFNTPKFVGSQLSIAYSEATYRYFRLTIFNEDDAPLSVASVQASGISRKLIFSAEPGVSYRLYYGNADANRPSYEFEHLFPYLVTENLPVANLGIHTANPQFTLPAAPQKPFTERYPWLVPTLVAIAALLIGIFLTSLFRQLKEILPPPPASN